MKLSADFSGETSQAGRDWQEIFKVMKSRDLQPRLLYLAKTSFRIEGHIKGFPDRKKLTEFIITKPLLPYFAEYDVVLCLMCTHIFGPNFQEKNLSF